MTTPPRSAKVADERVDSIKGYLRYLHSVAACPASINTEIERRKAEIAKHEAAISKLQNTVDNVQTLIAEQQAALKQARQVAAETKLSAKARRFRELHEQMARLQADIDRQEAILNA